MAAPNLQTHEIGKTPGAAIFSLIFGILSLFCFFFILFAPAAVISGHLALRKHKQGQAAGLWMTVTGLVLGYLVSALYLVVGGIFLIGVGRGTANVAFAELRAASPSELIAEPLPGFPEPADSPPEDSAYELITYDAEPGALAAYLTKDPGDGQRRPAILWAHGGIGGIGSYYWEQQDPSDDQTPAAFLAKGYVVMIPSWRGENDNPGSYEMFYGEVDDARAALTHLAALPYVDRHRIYMVGHSTGGTLTLLTAVSDNRLRAAFSLGGDPKLNEDTATDLASYAGVSPFDPSVYNELKLRSSIHYVWELEVPTFHVEGGFFGDYIIDGRMMNKKAKKHGRPFQSFAIGDGDHFDIVHPTTRLLAEELLSDDGADFPLEILTQAKLDEAYRGK